MVVFGYSKVRFHKFVTIDYMKKIVKNFKQSELMSIGCGLFFPGVLLATMLGDNRVVQVIGVAMIILSSAAFGASISANDRRKN